jgi:hypothetical protein
MEKENQELCEQIAMLKCDLKIKSEQGIQVKSATYHHFGQTNQTHLHFIPTASKKQSFI